MLVIYKNDHITKVEYKSICGIQYACISSFWRYPADYQHQKTFLRETLKINI